MEAIKTTTFSEFINNIVTDKDLPAILSVLDDCKNNPNTIPEGKAYEDILAQLTNNEEFIEKWKNFPYNAENKEIIDKNKTIIKELIKNVSNSTIDPFKIFPISNFIIKFILNTIIDEEFYVSLRQTNETIKSFIQRNIYGSMHDYTGYDRLKTQIIFSETLAISELNISQLTNEQIQEIIRLLLIKYNYEENKTSDKESMDKDLILTNHKETISQIWKIIIDRNISDIKILNDLIELTPIELIIEKQNYEFALGGFLYQGYINYLIIKLSENVQQNYDNVIKIVEKITNKYYTSEEAKKYFFKQILEYYNKTNNIGALFLYAYCYANGIGVTKDLEKAFELYQRAANLGNADAMYNLGVCYERGTGVAQALKKAAELYERTADCYQNGTGVTRDLKKAFEFYQRAANLGNVCAMNNLAHIYRYGIGVAQDLEKAFEFYQRAANLGNTNAIVNLGRCYANGKGVAQDMKTAFELFQKSFGIKETSVEEYSAEKLDHVIKLALASRYSDYYINNFEQWNIYTENIKTFIQENTQEKFGEFNTGYTLDFKKGGSDLGLTIISKPYNKKYFLKIYPYSEKTYKEKLTEVEYFKLLGSENSMKIFDLYTDKAHNCIIFCSEQALTGKIESFPKFDFGKIKEVLEQPKLKEEQSKIEEQKEKEEKQTQTREIVKIEKEQPKILLENNRDFKNLCQFFKIMIYSAMFNLGDVRDTNVLMAPNKQDDDKDIRVKLIDFWLGRHGNEKSLPDEIKLIDRNNGQKKEIIMKNPFLPKNNSPEESLSQIFLKQCIYLFLLTQSRENFGAITTPTSQGVCSVTKKILEFIQQESQIAEILEEKVLGYIEEVFGKIEELSKKTEELSKQPLSEPTTAVSSTTPPLPVQPSCDDTTKSPGTPGQSREDSKTLLEVRVKILKQFCDRYQYIQKQLEKFSQSKTTEKLTSEFVNPDSAEPTSGIAVAATTSTTTKYTDIADGQERLKLIQEKIAIIQKRLGGKSQISTLKSTASQSIVMTA